MTRYLDDYAFYAPEGPKDPIEHVHGWPSGHMAIVRSNDGQMRSLTTLNDIPRRKPELIYMTTPRGPVGSQFTGRFFGPLDIMPEYMGPFSNRQLDVVQARSPGKTTSEDIRWIFDAQGGISDQELERYQRQFMEAETTAHIQAKHLSKKKRKRR